MLVQKWQIITAVAISAASLAASLTAWLAPDHTFACFFCVAIACAAVQYFVVPWLMSWSMKRSFAMHYDMNPLHMHSVWAQQDIGTSTMLVATQTSHVVGVVAVLAGAAAVAMPALRDTRRRGPARAQPLFGDSVAAAAWCAKRRNTSYRPCSVFRVSVRPCSRGQGLGKQLMGAAEEWALQHGYTHVELTTASPTAIQFYEKLGYSVHFTKLSILGFRVVHMSKALADHKPLGVADPTIECSHAAGLGAQQRMDEK